MQTYIHMGLLEKFGRREKTPATPLDQSFKDHVQRLLDTDYGEKAVEMALARVKGGPAHYERCVNAAEELDAFLGRMQNELETDAWPGKKFKKQIGDDKIPLVVWSKKEKRTPEEEVDVLHTRENFTISETPRAFVEDLEKLSATSETAEEALAQLSTAKDFGELEPLLWRLTDTLETFCRDDRERLRSLSDKKTDEVLRTRLEDITRTRERGDLPELSALAQDIKNTKATGLLHPEKALAMQKMIDKEVFTDLTQYVKDRDLSELGDMRHTVLELLTDYPFFDSEEGKAKAVRVYNQQVVSVFDAMVRKTEDLDRLREEARDMMPELERLLIKVPSEQVNRRSTSSLLRSHADMRALEILTRSLREEHEGANFFNDSVALKERARNYPFEGARGRAFLVQVDEKVIETLTNRINALSEPLTRAEMAAVAETERDAAAYAFEHAATREKFMAFLDEKVVAALAEEISSAKTMQEFKQILQDFRIVGPKTRELMTTGISSAAEPVCTKEIQELNINDHGVGHQFLLYEEIIREFPFEDDARELLHAVLHTEAQKWFDQVVAKRNFHPESPDELRDVKGVTQDLKLLVTREQLEKLDRESVIFFGNRISSCNSIFELAATRNNIAAFPFEPKNRDRMLVSSAKRVQSIVTTEARRAIRPETFEQLGTEVAGYFALTEPCEEPIRAAVEDRLENTVETVVTIRLPGARTTDELSPLDFLVNSYPFSSVARRRQLQNRVEEVRASF